MLRLCSLGSGSGGNALVVEARDGLFTTRILIDDGFNLKQLERRLQRAGLEFSSLDAIFVTHEHDDHAGGVAACALEHRLPVYCTNGTAAAANFIAAEVEWNPICAGFPVELGPLRIDPFAVPHDAVEPVQFAFTDGNRRAALLTDAGESSVTIVAALSGLHALMLECNHDSALLRSGSYPLFLKARIAGGRGHLSNAQAAEILSRVDRRQLQWVAAAHLSRANNRPELAHASLAAVLGVSEAVAVADQEDGLDWREV